ncbi:MAG: hypothetical protein L3J36_03110 [Rhodobacteraceae bacterium]|nr:hypothetical protein [Paracoccaceae bacterium]
MESNYELAPARARLVQVGEQKVDDGGRWVPAVFQIGPDQYQGGAVPLQRGCQAVVHKVVWDDLGFARKIADATARLAAA